MEVAKDGLNRFVSAIRKSGFTIYTPIKIGDPTYWIPAPELEALLDTGLRGFSVRGLKVRTRSKVVKQQVCRVLGYPVPVSFKKTQPRFAGQCFDTYVQANDNLQIWNEALDPTRRYAVVRVDETDHVSRVKVVTGATLARLDTTGTLTQKYQARCIPGNEPAELITPLDTELLQAFTVADLHLRNVASPLQVPSNGELLEIKTIFKKLGPLIGRSFPDSSSDRNR